MLVLRGPNRGLLGVDQATLAEKAGVARKTIVIGYADRCGVQYIRGELCRGREQCPGVEGADWHGCVFAASISAAETNVGAAMMRRPPPLSFDLEN